MKWVLRIIITLVVFVVVGCSAPEVRKQEALAAFETRADRALSEGPAVFTKFADDELTACKARRGHGACAERAQLIGWRYLFRLRNYEKGTEAIALAKGWPRIFAYNNEVGGQDVFYWERNQLNLMLKQAAYQTQADSVKLAAYRQFVAEYLVPKYFKVEEPSHKEEMAVPLVGPDDERLIGKLDPGFLQQVKSFTTKVAIPVSGYMRAAKFHCIELSNARGEYNAVVLERCYTKVDVEVEQLLRRIRERLPKVKYYAPEFGASLDASIAVQGARMKNHQVVISYEESLAKWNSFATSVMTLGFSSMLSDPRVPAVQKAYFEQLQSGLDAD